MANIKLDISEQADLQTPLAKLGKKHAGVTPTNMMIQLQNQKDFSHDLIDRSLSKIRKDKPKQTAEAQADNS